MIRGVWVTSEVVCRHHPKCLDRALCGFMLKAGRVSGCSKYRPRMYLSCFAFINQPKKLQSFHLRVNKTRKRECQMVTGLLQKPPAACQRHQKPTLQRTAPWISDQRRKSRGKKPDKSFTLLSDDFL